MTAQPAVASGRLAAVIRAFAGRRILVVADLVADEFVYGRVQRVSREAPVLILEHDGAELRLGGGANAVHNIRTLGGAPLPVGVLGRDEQGRLLRRLLRERRIDVSRVFVDAGYVTPLKSRILAGGVHSTKQQVVRIDRVPGLAAGSPLLRQVVTALRGFDGRLDGVLVSD
jgi:D-glycero-beta-D-manno-heptose-7-phosphate kinase